MNANYDLAEFVDGKKFDRFLDLGPCDLDVHSPGRSADAAGTRRATPIVETRDRRGLREAGALVDLRAELGAETFDDGDGDGDGER